MSSPEIRYGIIMQDWPLVMHYPLGCIKSQRATRAKTKRFLSVISSVVCTCIPPVLRPPPTLSRAANDHWASQQRQVTECVCVLHQDVTLNAEDHAAFSVIPSSFFQRMLAESGWSCISRAPFESSEGGPRTRPGLSRDGRTAREKIKEKERKDEMT